MTAPSPTGDTCQEAFGKFQVRCMKCGSLRVEWQNDLGFSDLSGAWGTAGFRCLDCNNTVDMIESD